MNLVSAFTYDTRGNRTKEAVTGDENYVMTNTYDANNRLTNQAKTENGTATENIKYYYDANGNQTFKQTNTYSQGELMSVNAGNYTTGTVESFTYNLQNQLVNYQTSGTTARYEYGANGLRKKKSVNGFSRSFVWNGNNIAADMSGSVILNLYNYGVDGITTRETSNGDVSVYIKNAHGDAVGLADTNGNLTTNYQYDAFGNQLNSTTDLNPFRYCGEYYDSETNNIYLRARYYDSSTGRFINEDPIKDGLNWYSYCNENPVIFVDNCGLAPGDEFNSIEDAAIDFSCTYNEWSIKVDSEYATRIYSYQVQVIENYNGVAVVYDKTVYSYTNPFTDWKPKSVSIIEPEQYIEDNKKYIVEKAEARGSYNIKNVKFEAIAHTHGSLKPLNMDKEYYIKTYIPEVASIKTLKNIMKNSERFSDADINTAKKYGGRIFLVSPTGLVRKYDIATSKSITIYRGAPRDNAFSCRGL